jgi:hypothetical protein
MQLYTQLLAEYVGRGEGEYRLGLEEPHPNSDLCSERREILFQNFTRMLLNDFK